MREPGRWNADRPYLLLLPLLALIVVLPLLLHGCSCGHDFDFHLQSWLDAAAQFRHGALDPAWTSSAAWNAGEPRFLFYPPLSWMLGAALTLAFPISVVPVLFTWIALLGAGLSMYRLARAYTSPSVALLASAVYLANPYMLFTAFERTAYGELLAAVWLPLLLLAALRPKPTAAELAIPLALLWLTNAPAAVIGVYTLIAIAVVRIALQLWQNTKAAAPASANSPRGFARSQQSFALLARFAAGGALGLALPAFYLLPAAYERRYVQVAMAIIPNMRVQDNFLFGHTGNVPHDQVLHTASLLAASLLAATFVVLLFTWVTPSARPDAPTSSLAPTQTISQTDSKTRLVLALLTAIIALLLTPLSVLLWLHLPELAFLQFPWRLLSLLGAILALAVALLCARIYRPSAAFVVTSFLAAIALAVCGSLWGISAFRQPCDALDRPAARAQLFRTHHGVEPTDEYTPTNADNDIVRSDDPAFWLSPDPSAFAPGTVPNPAATIVNYDVSPSIDQTLSRTAPHHLELHLAQPQTLILNLRDYPAWQITRNGLIVSNHLRRDDGLLAIALPAGTSNIDIRWHRTWDQSLGDTISVVALLLLGTILRRSRTIKA